MKACSGWEGSRGNAPGKGWSADEVRDYLRSLADQIEAADAERTRLRAEVDRQRHEVHRLRSSQGPDQSPDEPSNEPDANAVALFSQAQQVADRLIEEAVQQARDLMSTARKQQRDILQQAQPLLSTTATGHEFSLPPPGQVRFFLLTTNGARVYTEAVNQVQKAGHRFQPLLAQFRSIHKFADQLSMLMPSMTSFPLIYATHAAKSTCSYFTLIANGNKGGRKVVWCVVKKVLPGKSSP